MSVRLGLQLNVGLISHDEVVLGELAFVSIQFLLEKRHFPLGMLVFELAKLSLMLLLKLGLLELEILLLGLDYNGQLRFLRLGLLD